MRVRFTKMQGAGNDFVVLDGLRSPVTMEPALARRLADRHFGVGCDQILMIEAPRSAGTDFYYRIFNADGEEVAQCGNGARCFARFVHDKGLSTENEIRVETHSGVIIPRLEADGEVTVNMGEPRFEPADVPFLAPGRATTYGVEAEGTSLELSVLSMGNPHAVLVVADVERAPVESLGPLLEHHRRFPERVNVGFLQILGSNRAKLRVFERGAGETLACGTGACAAAVAGIERGLLASPVSVQTRGGRLVISWAGPGHPVQMKGPAVTVFEGEIDI